MGVREALEVLSPGPLTTVQDLGRYGYGQYGVAPSGALDRYALRVGNLLAGNPENEACLEVALPGLRLRALTDLVVGLAGADLGAHSDSNPLSPWGSHLLRKGRILSFKALKKGFRAYVAVRGGLDTPAVLGSKSTNLPSGFGGYRGRPLRKGDVLSADLREEGPACAGRALDEKWIPRYGNRWTLRVVPGPQDDHFTKEAEEAFLGSPFKVTPKSDRTGIRLSGPPLTAKNGLEESIISEGVIAGNIQVPGDGQPIILLNETVSGGYRKIATVVSADLFLLGQIKPGDEVAFEKVSLEEAYRALREMEERLKAVREANPPR